MGLVVALSTLALGACGGGERQDEDEPEGDFPVSIVEAEFPTRQRLAQTSELTLAVRNEGGETIPDLAITINTRRQEDVGETSAETTTGEETATTEETTTTDLGDEPGEDGLTTTQPSPEPVASGPFSVISEQEDLAIPSRPVWILESGYPKLVEAEGDADAAASPTGEVPSAGAEAAQTNTFSFGELEPGETRDIVWKLTPVQAGAFTIDYVVAAGLFGKAVATNTDGSVPEGEFVVVVSDKPAQTRVNDQGKVVPIKKGDIIGQAGSKKQKNELGE